MKVCRLCRQYVSGGTERCAFDNGEILEGPIPPFAPGDALGSYRVQRALYAGQTGVILQCRKWEREASDKKYFIKVLNNSSGPIDAQRAVLERVASLTREGLHPILEVFEYKGRLCIVQTPLEGATLAVLLKKEGPLEPAETVSLGHRLCAVLTAIHKEGLAHYDVRPGHLFVPRGTPRGEALLFDLGSPSPVGHLSPPELFDQRPDPEKSDIYGLCMTLYVVLTAHSPFRSVNREELTWLVHNAPVPPVSVVRKSVIVDSSLERLINWGLSKDPAKRPTLAQVSGVLKAIEQKDQRSLDMVLSEADRAVLVADENVYPEVVNVRTNPLLRSPKPRLDDDSPTMKIVRKILPASMLKTTGLTQSFFIDGERMEREMEALAQEEEVARRENIAAWFRLITLLLIALILGGVTVWALTH